MNRDILPGTVNEVLATTLEHGGCTYRTHDVGGNGTGPVHNGVACANPQHAQHEKIVPLEQFSAQVVAEYVTTHAEILRQDGVHLGTWVNDGNVYLDLTTVYRTQAEALQAARKTQQLAVFNIGTGEEITVD